MSEALPPLAAALQRLGAAVDLLDAAAARRIASERNGQARAMELELMRADRARLAELLDQATARGKALENAHAEIEARVDKAIDLVTEALSVAGGPER